MPLFYHNTVVVDMCIAKIRHNQCITIGHTQVTGNNSNVGYWYIKFLNIAGCEIYTIGLKKCSLGPICSFENKLLLYHSQNTCILVFDTDSSFLNSTLSAIQVGKSWKFPANLTLVHFCVDFNKVFAMCHKHYTPRDQKCISLYEFDATSGK